MKPKKARLWVCLPVYKEGRVFWWVRATVRGTQEVVWGSSPFVNYSDALNLKYELQSLLLGIGFVFVDLKVVSNSAPDWAIHPDAPPAP